jgi:hypothetical protein
MSVTEALLKNNEGARRLCGSSPADSRVSNCHVNQLLRDVLGEPPATRGQLPATETRG